jgi:uncharacterized protein YvpB
LSLHRFFAFIILVLLVLLVGSCSPPSPKATPFFSKTVAPVVETTAVPSATPTQVIPTAEASLTPYSSSAFTQTPTPTATLTPVLPEEYYITGIFGHKQYFPLGCEASVATDWAAFFGVEINEFNFQFELPLSDNPDLGFVGDVAGPWGQVPPYAYGVHAAPVAELLRQHGLPASAYKGMTIEQIKAEIAEGQPVIAWVIGNMVGGVPAEYTDRAGNTTTVAAYEHVVLVTGYNETKLRYNSNGKFYEAPYAVFSNSWKVLGNMAIIYEDDKR